ncbi:TIM barrel protein [Streptomyces sp. NPDC051219]|uniref:sugar phosphate isomerase/epimerase family protein n=1 Tax=Streptomyces sp. NPDC051219 TaxID=3155283 RepID=UPI00341A8F48
MVLLGYETIQFAPKFAPDPPSLERQVGAAYAAGFSWIAFDRHSLEACEAQPGGLERLASICDRVGLPCREIQSLRVLAERDETLAGVRALCRRVAVLKPDVVPIVFFVPPTEDCVALTRELIALVRAAHAEVSFAIEFSPLFPVADVTAALHVVERLGCERVGLAVDTWHVFNGSSSLQDLAGLTPEQVPLIQFNDHGPLAGVPVDVAKDHRLLPGDGVFPLRGFVDLMLRNGIDGLVGVEIVSRSMRAWSPEEFAERAFRSAAAFWSPAGCEHSITDQVRGAS